MSPRRHLIAPAGWRWTSIATRVLPDGRHGVELSMARDEPEQVRACAWCSARMEQRPGERATHYAERQTCGQTCGQRLAVERARQSCASARYSRMAGGGR